MWQMQFGSSTSARRAAVALTVLAIAVSVLALGTARAGAVAWADVEAAEAAVSQASVRFAQSQSELAALRSEGEQLLASIARLEAREAEIVELAEEEGATITDRIARMYMTAGAGSVHLAIIDITDFSTRLAYLGAISERDRHLVNQFALTVVDLESLRDTAQERLADNAERVSELEAVVQSRVSDLEAARGRLDTVRAEWVAFEAAQRAAEEAALREQEAVLTGGQPPTTTTAPPSTGNPPPTTTTTLPTWVPSAGVEQWRPMVTEVLNRWGLNQTTCRTRNGVEFCVGPQVDHALKVMQCESSGNPMARNSSSGTSGLFQNHPAYWQDRVDRVRRQHADKEPNFPADASIFNPEYNTVVAALLVWESKQTLLGLRGGGGIGGSPWPEFNFSVYYDGNPKAYGYSVWGRGPNPWAHWTSCAATRGVNALGDSGPPYTYSYGNNIYDSGWIHPWAQQQSPP
jgi:hypothetical protein